MSLFVLLAICGKYYAFVNSSCSSLDGNPDLCVCVNSSTNIRDNDVNFEHLIEYALSCTLERVDKDVSYTGGLRFGSFDVGCLVKATKKEDIRSSLDRSSGSVLVERNMQNETAASLEAHSTKRDSGSIER